MAFKPHGIVVPIVTPVTQDGKFNEKAYRDLIEYLASSGIHGVFPFGTTGEFYAHDMGFYREVLAVTKDAVRGRMDIYAGANNITTRGAVEIAKAVEKIKEVNYELADMGLVEYTQYAPVKLTPQGRRIAGKIIVSHGILFDFLREELALPEERANEVACQIEHIMTFEEIEKLKSCRIRPFEGSGEDSAG